MSSSSSEEAIPATSALSAALTASAPASSAVLRMLLLDISLKASAADIRMLSEMLLLVSDSDSEAAVEAEADLLSLAAALALSLVLPRWLRLWLSEAELLVD